MEKLASRMHGSMSCHELAQDLESEPPPITTQKCFYTSLPGVSQANNCIFRYGEEETHSTVVNPLEYHFRN